MGAFRGLSPEVLESLALEPKGEEDEPDKRAGPYDLPHRIAETSPPKGVTGSDEHRPGGPTTRRRDLVVDHRFRARDPLLDIIGRLLRAWPR